MVKKFHKSFMAFATLLTFLIFFFGGSQSVLAHSTVSKGSVSVEDTGKTNPVDPENPENEVDPGESPSTEGPLRIDFVSELKFGLNDLSKENRVYTSLAQLFHDETDARGYYIQVTDRRGDSSGWELQVSQDHQFSNSIIQSTDGQELKGASLSFDHGWANSVSSAEAPLVTRDTIAINEMNSAYTVATSSKGAGTGVWTIEFGASSGNKNNQPNTLSPLVDKSGNPVIDEVFNKPAYSNSAITLSVPKTTKIQPVKYSTTLTWILTAGPTN